MNKFVTGEELNSVELLRGRVYYLRVADDITKMTTIVATFVETTSDGTRTTCEFEDAYVKGPDKINADKLIAGGRVAIKNFDGDKLTPLAAVFNPETLKSKKLRTKPFLLTPEKEREEAAAHPQEGKRRFELDQKHALSLRTQNKAHQQEDAMAFFKYMTAPKEEKDAEMRRMADLKRAHAKQQTLSKRSTGNLLKAARRASPKPFQLDEFPFEEGKSYALPVDGSVIVATFRKRTESGEFLFDEGKGDYGLEWITKDGRVALKARSPTVAEVFNPRTLQSTVLQSAPTLLALSKEQLEESLSDVSSEGLVYRRKTEKGSPYKPSGKPRLKSTVKSRPVPTTIDAFFAATRAAKDALDLAYSPIPSVTELGYLYLMKKYKSRCVLPGTLVYTPKLFEEGELTYEIKSKNLVKKARAVGDDLLRCVEKGVSVIFIPFRIKFLEKTTTHANMLIYRPFQNVVERFEPQVVYDKKINAALKHLFEEKLPKLGKPQFKFPQEDMNAALAQLNLPPMKGLQELEILAEGKKEEEGGGYCQMWSLFIMECILINPEMSTEAIIRQCYETSKADPQYLRGLIRGYVQNMSAELEKAMGKKADIQRGQPLTQKQRTKVAHLAEALAALYQKRHARTKKNEGSASSHSSAFKDSSGFSSEMGLP